MSGSRWITANVRGLGDPKKKQTMLKQLKQRKIDVAILTETKIQDENIYDLRQDEKYDCLSTGSIEKRSASRGVLILWNKHKNIEVKLIQLISWIVSLMTMNNLILI